MLKFGYLQYIQRPTAVTSWQAEQANSAISIFVAAASSRHKVHTQFSHRHTHNEQIIVAPYRVIIAHATFYSAKAVSSIVVHSSWIHLPLLWLYLHRSLFSRYTVTQTSDQTTSSLTTTVCSSATQKLMVAKGVNLVRQWDEHWILDAAEWRVVCSSSESDMAGNARRRSSQAGAQDCPRMA